MTPNGKPFSMRDATTTSVIRATVPSSKAAVADGSTGVGLLELGWTMTPAPSGSFAMLQTPSRTSKLHQCWWQSNDNDQAGRSICHTALTCEQHMHKRQLHALEAEFYSISCLKGVHTTRVVIQLIESNDTFTLRVCALCKRRHCFQWVRLQRIRYDTRCYFNVRSKANTSQLNLPHGNRQLKSVKTEKTKSRKQICPEITVNSPGNPCSKYLSRKKGRATLGKICREGRF